MLDHGNMVWSRFQDLIADEPKMQWRMPDWFIKHKQDLIARLPSMDIMEEYLTYHDCGKPSCRTVDEEGRQHFPDHASASCKIWSTLGSPEAAKLMGMDMDIHLLKGDDIPDFIKKPECCALLLAGFAEIHANAEMFGGLESTGFKIKWKHIDKRGRAICKALFEEVIE